MKPISIISCIFITSTMLANNQSTQQLHNQGLKLYSQIAALHSQCLDLLIAHPSPLEMAFELQEKICPESDTFIANYRHYLNTLDNQCEDQLNRTINDCIRGSLKALRTAFEIIHLHYIAPAAIPARDTDDDDETA